MELTDEKLNAYDAYVTTCYGKGKWFASVWDLQSLKRIAKIKNIPYIKIPSAKLTDDYLISKALETRIPFILSTGMSYSSEVWDALGEIKESYPLTVMHCHAGYPAPENEANLRVMDTLRDELYGNSAIGFSSHFPSPHVAIGALWMGAEMVEVHFTLDRTLPGSDHAASLEYSGLNLLVRERNRRKKLLGDGNITLYDSELPARKKLRGI